MARVSAEKAEAELVTVLAERKAATDRAATAEAAARTAFFEKETAVASAESERKSAVEACDKATAQAETANARAATAEEAAASAHAACTAATVRAEAAEAKAREMQLENEALDVALEQTLSELEELKKACAALPSAYRKQVTQRQKVDRDFGTIAKQTFINRADVPEHSEFSGDKSAGMWKPSGPTITQASQLELRVAEQAAVAKRAAKAEEMAKAAWLKNKANRGRQLERKVDVH